MKFIIRDDDVNAMYEPRQLEEWYKGIFEICPISICAVPFIKGDYFKWVYFAENDKEGFMAHKEEFYNDDVIHPLGDNKELVDIIKRWQSEGKVSISMHGIHHRNWDRNAPDIANNYSTGAEFWTDEDRTEALRNAKTYLEKIIGHSINAFTAPQNLISYQSYKSLRNVGLNICGTLANPRKPLQFIDVHGLKLYFKYIFNYIFHKEKKSFFQYESNHKGLRLVTYTAGVYPNGKKLEEVKRIIEHVHSVNGIFVFNTHSYGFDTFLPQDSMTVKQFIIEILKYTQQFDDVEYTTLEEVLK